MQINKSIMTAFRWEIINDLHARYVYIINEDKDKDILELNIITEWKDIKANYTWNLSCTAEKSILFLANIGEYYFMNKLFVKTEMKPEQTIKDLINMIKSCSYDEDISIEEIEQEMKEAINRLDEITEGMVYCTLYDILKEYDLSKFWEFSVCKEYDSRAIEVYNLFEKVIQPDIIKLVKEREKND